MKKIVLSNDQIKQVINLHESGISWVKIGKEMGIARRIAKREYDEWANKQSERQLEDARKDVAAQEYRMHLDLLSKMANLILDSLVIPNPPRDMREADEVMRQLLAQDIYQDQPLFRPRLRDQLHDKRIVRMNELLFKSLHDHTERKVPWQFLDTWKEARDSCIKNIENMKKESKEVLNNILNQDSKLKADRDKIYKSPSMIEKINEGILINIWLNGVLGIDSQVTAMKGASLNKQGTNWVVFHKNAPEETNVTFDQESHSDNERIAKEVRQVSKWAIANLLNLKSDLIKTMRDEVSKMQESYGRLETMLNPLVLRPIILNTKCDICPI